MKRILLSAFIACFSLLAEAQQDTIFLNAQGEIVRKKDKAKECVLIRKGEKGIKWVDFYTLDGKLTASSQYKKFGKTPGYQVLHGAAHYRFSNSEQDSLLVFYKDNRRNGGATFYYPNGKVMAQCQYKDGALDGLSRQFYEDGKLKRTEIYQNNRSIGGKLFAPDSTELAFSPFYEPAQVVTADERTLLTAIGKYMNLPTELFKEMSTNDQSWLSANIGIVVNATGKAIDLVILDTQHPKLNKNCFLDVTEHLSNIRFIPGKIDGQEATTIMLLKEPFVVRITPSTTFYFPNSFRKP